MSDRDPQQWTLENCSEELTESQIDALAALAISAARNGKRMRTEKARQVDDPASRDSVKGAEPP